MYFFQAEDGIRDVERSRGLGDVYKRQVFVPCKFSHLISLRLICVQKIKIVKILPNEHMYFMHPYMQFMYMYFYHELLIK